MTANFDISFFAYVRITFIHNYKLGDNLLKDIDTNTANAVVYMSCAEYRHVNKFYKKLIRTYASFERGVRLYRCITRNFTPIANPKTLLGVFASRVPAAGCGWENLDFLFACEYRGDSPHPLKNCIFIILATVTVCQRLSVAATPNIEYLNTIFIATYGLWHCSKTIDLVRIATTRQNKRKRAKHCNFLHDFLPYHHDANTNGSDRKNLLTGNSRSV